MKLNDIFITIANRIDSIKSINSDNELSEENRLLRNLLLQYTNEDIVITLKESINKIKEYKLDKFKDITEYNISIDSIQEEREITNTVFINDSIGDQYRFYTRELTVGYQLPTTIIMMNDLNNLIGKTTKFVDNSNVYEIPKGLNIFIFLSRKSKDNSNTHSLEIRFYSNK